VGLLGHLAPFLNFQSRRTKGLALVTLFLSLSTMILGQHFSNIQPNGTGLKLQPPSSNSPITEFPIPFANPGPNSIVSAPNHIFWFVEYNTGAIGEFNETAKTFNQFPIPEASATPASLALDGMGRIWFTDQNKTNPSIWVLNASASPVTFHQYLTNTPNSTPVFVIADNVTNNVWFTDTTANYIGKIDHLTGRITQWFLPTSNSGPAELAFQNNTSYLWITESFANKVARFDMASGHFQEFTPTLSLVSPVGITVDKNGNVWVSEHGASSVAELIPSNSTFRKYPTSQPTTYKTTAPATISIDKLGRFWFVEHFGNRVGRLDPTTGIMDEFVIPTSGFAYSLRNALDSSGNFWFTEYSANQIGMIESNATSPINISPPVSVSYLAPITINAGQSITSLMSISNHGSSLINVKLNVTSTFTTYGQTSIREVALSNYNLTLAPNQAKPVAATISPDSSLPSGIYAAGVEATYGNASIIGLVFLQVHGNVSILGLLLTYLPAIVVAAAAVLLVTGVLVKRRRGPANLSARIKSPIATIVVLAFVLVVYAVGVIPDSAAKCIGLPPPPNQGTPTGPDYFGYALDFGSLGFFALVAFLLWRDWRRRKSGTQ
jgi:virginiamycin B lyase